MNDPAPRTVLVTRPGPGGDALAQALAAAGHDALWWPAFDLAPLDADAGDIGRYDVAIFVSPAAARFAAAALPGLGKIPIFAAVGAGTRGTLADAFERPAAQIIAPPDESGGGSDELYPLLAPLVAGWRRALILRAQEGREELASRLGAAGVEVTQLAVYRRAPHRPEPAAARALEERARRGGDAALVVTSSAAVDVLEAQFGAVPGVAAWLHRGIAIASHERIAARLRAAGYREVLCGSADAGSIVALLR
jgi:uroporphyrinogen-III synthase